MHESGYDFFKKFIPLEKPGLLFLFMVSMFVVSISAAAQETQPPKNKIPSQEFWDYMEEYGDDSGNVIDPLEFDQSVKMKKLSDKSDDVDVDDIDVPTPKNSPTNPTVNAAMKQQGKSFSHASSSSKGDTL